MSNNGISLVVTIFRKIKYLLVILAVLLMLEYFPQPTHVSNYKLIDTHPITEGFMSCNKGIVLVERSKQIVLRSWKGDILWSVDIPTPELTGWPVPDQNAEVLRAGWLASVSSDGRKLAILRASNHETNISIWIDGHKTGDYSLAIVDDYLGLCTPDNGNVIVWSRSNKPYPIWIIDKDGAVAHGNLPWYASQITPDGSACVAPSPPGQYSQYNGYNSINKMNYGEVNISGDNIRITDAYSAQGLFLTHNGPESITKHITAKYPQVIDQEMLFTSGVVLSLTGDRFGPNGKISDRLPMLNYGWISSSQWISYSYDVGYENKCIIVSPVTGKKWTLPYNTLIPVTFGQDGRFVLVENIPHNIKPSDILWDITHDNELLSPSGYSQTRIYMGLLDQSGKWIAELSIARDAEEYWPIWTEHYRISWSTISPDGRYMTLIGRDDNDNSRCLFFRVK